MTVSDAFCRVNRARGYEVFLLTCKTNIHLSIEFQLISPEDLLNAAMHMERLNLPVRYEKNGLLLISIDRFSHHSRLRVLSSGVKSFELVNHNEQKELEQIQTLVSD